MEDRLKLDEENLREAVGIFRTNANLHNSSSDEALIRYAHEGGKGKPHANMVREKWHDFENGRRYAALPVTPYSIKYQTQQPLFDEPPPIGEPVRGITKESLERAEGQYEAAKDEFGKAILDIAVDAKRREGAGESDATGVKSASVGADDPAPSCQHIDMVLDETGRENVCADCGELLGPADPEPNSSQGNESGSDEGKGKVAASDASGTASDPNGADSSKQDDEEEVLF